MVMKKEREKERYGENDVGHVAVTSDDLEPGNGVLVAHDVGDLAGTVLLYPRHVVTDAVAR